VGEMISQTAELLVYLGTIRMRTGMSSCWSFLLPGRLRCNGLGGGRDYRRERSNGLQEMCLRTINERILSVTGHAANSTGPTLVNGIVNH
jgi:hypothetical protein